jgi:malonate transporter MadL subunit
MVIYGVTLLAFCYLAGQILGELLGRLLGIDTNIGGVGFAMLLLVLLNDRFIRKGYIQAPTEQGILFWSHMYVPIIVAMSATQNVKAAVSSGFVAVVAGIVPVALCFWLIPSIAKLVPKPETL